MDLGWNPAGAFSLGAMMLTWALAALVYFTRPERLDNRLLAIALFLGGTANGFYFGLRLMAVDAAGSYQMLAIGTTLLIFLGPVYTLVAATLQTPLTRPLRSVGGRVAMIAYVGLLQLAWFLRPDWFIVDFHFSPPVSGWQFDTGPLLEYVVLPLLGVSQVFGLIAAVQAHRRATTDAMRARTKMFAIAFGTRDALQVLFIVAFVGLNGLAWPYGPVIFEHGIPVSDTIFALLLAYGILCRQLFDIDLRVKASVRRAAIGTAFVVAFFVAEQIGQLVLASATDSFWIGLAGAALLGLALVPLRRFAAKLANALMPRTTGSEDYVALRKSDVYREAAEGVLVDGNMTSKERALLDRLREKLGLTIGEAQTLEAEALAAMTALLRASRGPTHSGSALEA